MIEELSVDVSSRDHLRGSRAAPVVLVEYGDFACPFCAAAYPVVRALVRHYGTLLGFVFRHNALGGLNRGSTLAAYAAEAAAEQGLFWEMHDLLFERGVPEGEAELASYAALLGLDVERFRSALHEPHIAARVRDDERGGLQSGVIGTPTFFINGRHFRDRPDFETLSRAIEAVLERSSVPLSP